MPYIDGFLLAVPSDKKQAYHDHATRGAAFLRTLGVTRQVECWADDVAHGKLTDMYRAVQAEEGESIVFAWVEYPDKATRDAANARMMSGDAEVMAALGDMPFDGKRMIFSGFAPILAEGNGGDFAYLDGYVIPVPADKADDYAALARATAPIFLEHGAIQVVETWGDDLMQGETTDFFRAVAAEPGENVVFSWICWPDKATRDAGNAAVMADPRFAPGADAGQPGSMAMLFNPQRMIMGGFAPLLIA